MLYENELDAVLREMIARWNIPGMVVGIIQGNEILYARGFGVQSLETQKPVTSDSVFCVSSVSKCFAATAVIQLVECGQISLETPLIQYLPFFRMNDERYSQITIRQMLSHTSGMPDLDETEYAEMVVHPEWDGGAAERWVRSLRDKRLVADPGERFCYSNIAYSVLGVVIAKVSGKSFESYMREHVLVPAGMPNSTFLLSEVPPEFLAVPHLSSPDMKPNPTYPYHRADAPSSFLHATLPDMCHWCITTLNKGKYLRQSILSPASYDLMWSPAADWGSPRPDIYEDMGLGWTLGHFNGVKTISQGGMGFGWTDFLLILPEKNRAAVILCNEESFARSRTVRAVADALLDQKPQAGSVSWIVPISRALAAGGIQAAYARCEEILASESQEYSFAEEDLVNLSLQLLSAKKVDLAIEVLGLNIHVYPEHVDSYLEMAKLYLKKGEHPQFEESLLKALAIEPGNISAAQLLKARTG